MKIAVLIGLLYVSSALAADKTIGLEPDYNASIAVQGRITAGKTFDGLVVGVTDGDTITVRFKLKPADFADSTVMAKVRLSGVDAPENNQPFGKEATNALYRMVYGKQVIILSCGEDKYYRVLGVVYTGKSPTYECVNTKLVREGFAWHYKEYSDSKVLANVEMLARDEKKGLWVEQKPIAPWDWRHGKSQSLKPSELQNSPTPLITNPIVNPPIPLTVSENKYWITTSSRKRHNSGCRYYSNSVGRLCGPNEGVACKICGG